MDSSTWYVEGATGQAKVSNKLADITSSTAKEVTFTDNKYTAIGVSVGYK